MKYKTQGHCPYCDTELGIITGWGMSVQGFQEYLKKHEANHPENTPNGIPTDSSYTGGVNFDPDIKTLEERLATQKAELLSQISTIKRWVMTIRDNNAGTVEDEFVIREKDLLKILI